MACPLFIPSSPLGDLYGGSCAADPSVAIEAETLRRYCNFGYARGHCARAAQSDADAVRLLVRGARGSIVEISWAVERNHHPVAVGSVEIDTGPAAEPAGDALARQAYACAAAYSRHSHNGQAFVGQTATAAHP